jgi:hypothetical protein
VSRSAYDSHRILIVSLPRRSWEFLPVYFSKIFDTREQNDLLDKAIPVINLCPTYQTIFYRQIFIEEFIVETLLEVMKTGNFDSRLARNLLLFIESLSVDEESIVNVWLKTSYQIKYKWAGYLPCYMQFIEGTKHYLKKFKDDEDQLEEIITFLQMKRQHSSLKSNKNLFRATIKSLNKIIFPF